VLVAVAMPRRSRNSPTTTGWGTLRRSCAGMLQLLLRALISENTCDKAWHRMWMGPVH
jgi:hypothetical protein